MDEKLKQLLKDRGVDEDTIRRMEEEKVNCYWCNYITDSNHAVGLFHVFLFRSVADLYVGRIKVPSYCGIEMTFIMFK